MKKILIFLLLFFSFGSVFAGTKSDYEAAQEAYSDAIEAYNKAQQNGSVSDSETSSLESAVESAGENLEIATEAYLNSEESSGMLNSAYFTIDTASISPGIDISDEASTTSGKVNFLLGTIIQKMMVALGSLSVLVMIVGGGYMILHNGQDELLSKGKSIFMAGIYAMLVALSSYYLIVIVRFLLYNDL